MPNHAVRLSRRTALRAAGLTVGAAAGGAVLAGCSDDPDRTGEPGVTDSPGGTARPDQPTPSTDPAIVAALQKAAGEVQQLIGRYRTVSQTFPALRTGLATGSKHHAAHLAKLTELGDLRPPAAAKLPPVPTESAAALADLAGREQKSSVAHATAATKVSGPAARLLASIAASESQLAASLARKPAGR